MAGDGCYVTLTSMDFARPARCASCMGPSRVVLGAWRTTHLGRLSRTLAIPYCITCARRIRSARTRDRACRWLTAAIAGGAAVVGLALPDTPLGPVLGAAMLLALVATSILRRMLAPIPPASPARAGGDGEAVWLVSFRRFESVVYCANPAWGAALAHANDVRVMPHRRRAPFAPGVLRLAIGLTLAVTSLAWLRGHPSARRVQHLPELREQGVGRERLRDEPDRRALDAVLEDRIVGVA